MKLIEVKNTRDKRLFIKISRNFYKDDPNFVCPPDMLIESIFDPKKNVYAREGDFCRWYMVDEKGNLTGRVAAFINPRKAYGFQQPTGGMGFFECVDDQDAANMLFDRCRDWLMERGMLAMDGPVNFGENENYWGLLVDGFIQPAVGMAYNKPYYQKLFENYGFKLYFEQVTNHLNLTKPFPERFWKIADWVRQKPGYRFVHATFANLDKYIDDLREIYEEAWENHENFVPMDIEDLRKKVREARSYLIEDFIWFAYNENEPIAFLVMYPDINQVLKYFNGKMHLLNKMRFAYLIKKRIITRARIVVMGVKPKYQRYGIESGIFWHMDKMMKKYPEYTELELSWVGDFNPKMRALHENVGATFGKRHITYRKVFKGELDCQRSKIIPLDTKYKNKS